MHLQPAFVEPAHEACEISQQEENHCDHAGGDGPASGRMLNAILATTRPLEHGGVLVAGPLASVFPESASSADSGLAKDVLVRRVIADDPVAPEGSHRIDIQGDPVPSLRSSGAAGGSGIEHLPAISREVCLDPRMRVLGANDVVSRDVVEFV